MKIKIFVPTQDFRQVETALKQSGVKFRPFYKVRNNRGYHIEFDPVDHPLLSYLILKYDISIAD